MLRMGFQWLSQALVIVKSTLPSLLQERWPHTPAVGHSDAENEQDPAVFSMRCLDITSLIVIQVLNGLLGYSKGLLALEFYDMRSSCSA